MAELDSFDKNWSGKYPESAKSLKDNRTSLSTYFKYLETILRLFYTLNSIERFSRQLQKVAKSKTIFSSDDRMLKMLYLAMMAVTKK